MADKIPAYEQHEHAKCFRCGSICDGPTQEDEHFDSKYRKFCSKCQMFTFYNLIEPNPAPRQ